MSRSEAFKNAWAIVKGQAMEKVSGVKYGRRQEAIRRLERYAPNSVKVQLVRVENQIDTNAIAVYVNVAGSRAFKMGDLPATEAASIAPADSCGGSGGGAQDRGRLHGIQLRAAGGNGCINNRGGGQGREAVPRWPHGGGLAAGHLAGKGSMRFRALSAAQMESTEPRTAQRAVPATWKPKKQGDKPMRNTPLTRKSGKRTAL